MRFVNPYVSIYYRPESLREQNHRGFEKEVYWTFLKNLDSRLGLYQHRLNIVIVDKELSKKTFQFGSVNEYYKVLEPSFSEMNESECRSELLKLVHESFTEIGKENNWDLDIIDDAFEKSKSEPQRFEYRTTPKLNRSKGLSGTLQLNLTGDQLTFHAEIDDIQNGRSEVFRLLTTNEDNLSWHKRFKEFGWFDKLRFGLKLLGGDLWIVVNLETKQVEEIKRSKKFEIEEIEDCLEEIKKKPAYN